MKKTLCVFAAALFMGSAAWAEKIDQGEAYRIASEFFGGSIGRKLAPATEPTPKLALAKATDAYYAFNRGTSGGYVIVAADDRAANEVLGFADSGTFSADSMPGAMRWWLDEYGRQMPQGKPRLKRVLPVYDAIEPMVTARWDQGDPYNALCPAVGGETSLTGCAATAVAQIMYYHKWPERGTGSHSYSWNNGYYDETLSVDFSQSAYGWESMTDTYDESSSLASRNAVAKLMYDLGVSCEMQYSPVSSSATPYAISKALVDYFGYSKGTAMLRRQYYGVEEWEKLIYDELAAGRPVFYSGQTGSNAGHGFVCDGYRDGYFHINWGWSGMSDGYFLLHGLGPEAQGAGGSNAGYNFDQTATVGICPASASSVVTPLVYCEGDFDFEQQSTHPSSTVVFSGGFYNYGLSTVDFTLGIKVVNTSTNATQYLLSEAGGEMGPNYGYLQFSMNLSTFPKTYGTYLIYPAFRDNSRRRWYDVRTMATSSNPYLVATVSSNGVRIDYPDIECGGLAVSGLKLETSAYFSSPFKASVNLTNTNSDCFYAGVALALLEPGTMSGSYVTGKNLVMLEGGQSMKMEFDASLGYSFTPGDYELVVVNQVTGEIISDRLPVSVGVASSNQLLLYMRSAPTMDYAGPAVADDIRFTAEVECLLGSYFNTIVAGVFYEDEFGDISVSTVFMDELYANEGDVTTLKFKGSIPDAVVGKEYYLMLFYLDDEGNLKQIASNSNYMSFTIGKLTPVEEVEAEASQPHDIEVYTLAGVRVLTQKGAKADLSSLPAGVYIVKEGDKVSRVAKR